MTWTEIGAALTTIHQKKMKVRTKNRTLKTVGFLRILSGDCLKCLNKYVLTSIKYAILSIYEWP